MSCTAIQNIKEKMKNNKPIINYLSTGFKNLNKAILGFQKGELISILSSANGGATSFVLSSVIDAIHNKQTVKYYLSKDTKENLISKIICIMHNIPLKNFLLGEFGDRKLEDFEDTFELISKYLTIEEDLYFDIDTISYEIENIINADLIIIDNYLYLKSEINKKLNIVKELKRLAYVSQTPIILLNHFDINLEKRFEKIPMSADIIDAFDMMNYCDKVIGIYSIPPPFVKTIF